MAGTVTLICPGCYARSTHPLDALPTAHGCLRCGTRVPLATADRTNEAGAVKMCFGCGSGYFYTEKDFNAWIGAGIIAAGAVAYLIFSRHMWAILILLGVAALDLVFYLLVPRRTICYKCLATYRGLPIHPKHGPHDLGIASRFSDERTEKDDPGAEA